MARDSQESAPMSRFRAFTTSLGFKPSGGMSRSSSDQSPGPERRASMTSLRPLYGNFTLYLRVHSARNLPAVAQGSYCKLYLGDTPMVGGFGQGKSLVGADKRQGNSHQTFHTKMQMSATRDCPEWNEKFQMNVKNPNTEILTIRVKNHVLIYSPAIGACVVHLRQLQLGETVDEWFPLYRNDKPSGEIRLQICLQEKVAVQVPKRKYSQPSEETIQRLMQEHRELEEAQRRELELQQQEKWRRMEEDAVKHVGLEQQVAREEKWREQNARRMDEDHPNQHEQELPNDFKKEEASDSDLPASFKYRGGKKHEKVLLKQDTEEDKREEVDFAIPSGYTIDRADSANSYPSQLSEFATIRLSVEELEQVVQNALPTSDSSDSTESERERRRRRDKKRRHRKKHSKRKTYRDESSDDSSHSSRYRKGSSKTKIYEGESYKKRSVQGSVSSRSEASTQNPDIPTTLTYPRSHSAESSSSEDSEDERRRRRRRRAERAKRREKERKRRSRRKHKGRRNYESSYSSSLLSSSSLSSSEEERLARKLKKKKEKTRAKLAESGDSRASTQSSGMHQPSYANSRTIDSVSPYVAQQWKPERIDVVQVGGPQEDRNAHVAYAAPAASFVPSSDVQPARGNYGPDGFDEPDEPTATPQYLGQTTKEQTNAELMRSFCF